MALSIAAALQAQSFAAMAQDSGNAQQSPQQGSEVTELDTVKVVGTYRASLEKALEAKRDSAEQ
ncbi:MAG: hypothetical protein QM612_05020, partial [Thermomonas sp.]